MSQSQIAWLSHLGESWEEIVRASIPDVSIDGARWQPAQPWWGGAGAGPDAEIDVVAAHRDDRTRLLVGEVKLSLAAADVPRQLHDLEAKARLCDWARDKQLTLRLWTLRWQGRSRRPPSVIDSCELQGRWRAAARRNER